MSEPVTSEPVTSEPVQRLQTPWAVVRQQLEQARSYWICTTRPDGRPHAAPVWGVWMQGRLWFSTDPTSVKSRNLAANPAVAVHLQSADDAVMVEGTAELIRDPDELAAVDVAYAAKYLLPESGLPCHLVDPASMQAYVLVVTPRTGHTWLERAFLQTMTRWRWPDGGGGDPVGEETSYG